MARFAAVVGGVGLWRRAGPAVVWPEASGLDQPRLGRDIGVLRGRAARQRAGPAFRLSCRQSRGLTVVYLPPAFTETRTERLIEHIERYEFGMLVSHGPKELSGGLIASQVPFLLEHRDGILYLQGHLA